MDVHVREILKKITTSFLLPSSEWSGEVEVKAVASELDDLELPQEVTEQLRCYFLNGDEDCLRKVMLWIARTYVFSGYYPNEHQAVVAHLHQVGVLDVVEALRLVQLDTSNFRLMSQRSRDLNEYAESIAEEVSLGLLDIDLDRAVKVELAEYLREWTQSKKGTKKDVGD